MNWFFIAKKELLELKSVKGKNIFIGLFLLLSLGYGLSGGRSSVIPKEYALYYLALLTSVGFSSQLTSDLISSERKQNTLEIFKSLKVGELSIVFGKCLPSSIIGTLFSLAGISIVQICFSIMKSEFQSSISLIGLIFILLMNYITTTIVIAVSIWINDEKLMPVLSVVFPVIFILISIFCFSFISQMGFAYSLYIFTFLLSFLCVVFTYLTSILLKASYSRILSK